jgi:hypothetical protein
MFRQIYRLTYRYIPFVNLMVSTTGIMFQTTVLYPWHETLSKELRLLKDVKDVNVQRIII